MDMRGPPMKILVIISDPDLDEKSPCRSIVAQSINTLKNNGHTITVTDLAKDGWNEVLSVKDFTKVSDPIHINIRLEQQIYPIIPKIKEEQSKVLDCDFLMIFGPVSWFGLPSYFYAWWDRVFTHGSMYSPGTMFGKGVFSKKRAIVVATTTSTTEIFGRESIFGRYEQVIYPITHGMLHTVGFKVHRSQLLYLKPNQPNSEIIRDWDGNLNNINQRTYIAFNKPSDYTNYKLTSKDPMNDFDKLDRFGDMAVTENAN